MWLCNYHRRQNKEHMEKHKAVLQKKGLTLAMTSWVMQSASSPSESAQVSPIQSIEEATRKLANTEQRNSRSKTVKVIPPPIGQPMFLFFHVKGKKDGCNCFFDNGCSTACFREGIPGGELNAEKIASGPFQIGGVGGITAKANVNGLLAWKPLVAIGKSSEN